MPNRCLNENDLNCSLCETKIRETNKTGLCGKHYHQWWCNNKMKESTKEINRIQSINGCIKRKKERYHIDPSYRLCENMRSRFYAAIKGNKKNSVKELVGCSPEELKLYLESKFQLGMNWSNQGYRGWHVDHIIPLSLFNLNDPEEVSKAFHYTNLQPLWAKDNLKKGARHFA